MSDPTPEVPPIVAALVEQMGMKITTQPPRTILVICSGLIDLVEALEEDGFAVAVGRDGHHLFAFDIEQANGTGFPDSVAISPNHESGVLELAYRDELEGASQRIEKIIDALNETTNLDEEHAALFDHKHD